jgi:hypothetical protein
VSWVLWSLCGVDHQRPQHLVDLLRDLEPQLVELPVLDVGGDVVVRVEAAARLADALPDAVGDGRERQEGGPHAVPADVREVETDRAAGEGDDPHRVARQVGAGVERAGDAEPGEVHLRRREEGLLDARRQPYLVLERLLGAPKPLLGVPARGDVRLDADEVGDLARLVADGRDRQPVPERRPVPAVVEDLLDALALPRDGGADPFDRGAIRVGALEEPAVPPQHLGGGVARHALEALVHVDQGTVREAGVGDRDPLGRHVEGPVLQRELVPGRPLPEEGREGRRPGGFRRLV